MFCLKYPPSCFLSPSDSLARTGALPSKPGSSKQGVALAGDKEGLIGSSRQPPGSAGHREGLGGAGSAPFSPGWQKNLTEENPAC